MESMLLLVVLFGIMYVMMIRPESKRKKKVEAMRAGVRKGDTVTTIGGIVGKVVSVRDEMLTIETSEDRVRIELVKWSIQNVEAVADKTVSEDNVAGKKSLFGKKKAEEPAPVAVPEEPVAEEAVVETTEEN